eukprot:scaffold62613_cov15-Tisochrysis_lutea.AAC.1
MHQVSMASGNIRRAPILAPCFARLAQQRLLYWHLILRGSQTNLFHRAHWHLILQGLQTNACYNGIPFCRACKLTSSTRPTGISSRKARNA